VVKAPAADELYASAARFAQSALDAHHRRDHQRVALDAGTALEHLTKACLAKRSPALLAELKTGPNNWPSLLLLCGYPEGKPRQLRTVGLREALDRVKTFVSSVEVTPEDLTLLINLRDGVVHVALDDEVEERLLVAFAQQAKATLEDMKKSSESFWGDRRLDVVEALLADASDKVAHRVQVKLKNAEVAFDERYGELPVGLRSRVTSLTLGCDSSREIHIDCPACGCTGIASGDHRVDSNHAMDSDGEISGGSSVVFASTAFRCEHCGLRLDTPAEVAAAGMPKGWERRVLQAFDCCDSSD
jgi:hypothetical protein